MANTNFNINATFKGNDKLSGTIQRIKDRLGGLNSQARNTAGSLDSIHRINPFSRLNAGLIGIRSGFSQLRASMSGVSGALAGLAGAVGIAKIGSMINDFAGVADASTKFAQNIGITVEALQELRYAGEINGVATEEMNGALASFTKILGEAKNKTGVGVEAFKQLGISYADIKKASPDEAINLIADAFKNIKDPVQQTTLAMNLFGETAGLKMVGMLNQGSSGIEQIKQEARDLGLVFSEEMGESAGAFGDSLYRLKSSFSAVVRVIATDLMPVLTPIMDKLREFITNNKELVGNLVIGATAFLTLAGGLIAAGAAISAIVGPIGAVITIIKGLSAVLLANPLGLAIAAIATAAYLIYDNWEPISKFFKDLWNSIEPYFTKTWDFIKPILEFTPLGAIIANWVPILDFFGNLWKKISEKVSGIMNLANKVGSFFSRLNPFSSDDDETKEVKRNGSVKRFDTPSMGGSNGISGITKIPTSQPVIIPPNGNQKISSETNINVSAPRGSIVSSNTQTDGASSVRVGRRTLGTGMGVQ